MEVKPVDEIVEQPAKRRLYFPRSMRRAAGMRGKFIGRNGRPSWTPKRKVKA